MSFGHLDVKKAMGTSYTYMRVRLLVGGIMEKFNGPFRTPTLGEVSELNNGNPSFSL